VICPRPIFKQQLYKIVDLWELAATCQIDLRECYDLKTIEKTALSSQIFELQEKLTSPWRSPWLWLGVGLLAGAGLGFGLHAL
jgi:hypothetical protein